ncbi:hypothetical protein GHR37_29240 [Achromobacter xylosoxidans]|nr:hypothetical protein [Achromobacter xylosoxidans]
MNDNNAAQPVLTDDEINAACGRHADDTGWHAQNDRKKARAVESALLSKLRAPIADERAAFAAIAKRRAAEVAAMNIADGHGRFLNAQGHQQAISALDFCVAQFSALPGSLAGGNWRDEFSRRVYEDLAAADNQDVPLEEYPARILGVLDALASAPVAEPETMEEIHRQERERSPWKLPKDPTLPDCAPVTDESPMAKMADALREKARQEQQAYQDRRNQATEWGPMPEGTEADNPTLSAPVAPPPQIRLSPDVLEYLKEGVENATGCEESDVDYDFANELLRLINGPIYTAPVAGEALGTIFWDATFPAEIYDTLGDAMYAAQGNHGLLQGDTIEIQQAVRLPALHIRVTDGNDEGDNFRYVVIGSDAVPQASEAVRDALWTLTEHNALHFGEQHNTVIQGRAALSAQPDAEPLSNPKQLTLTAADERTAFEATYQADYDDPGAACEREHFGKGYRAGMAAQSEAQTKDIPANLLERLRHHAADKSNTAFARSTMSELAGYLSPTQHNDGGAVYG